MDTNPNMANSTPPMPSIRFEFRPPKTSLSVYASINSSVLDGPALTRASKSTYIFWTIYEIPETLGSRWCLQERPYRSWRAESEGSAPIEEHSPKHAVLQPENEWETSKILGLLNLYFRRDADKEYGQDTVNVSIHYLDFLPGTYSTHRYHLIVTQEEDIHATLSTCHRLEICFWQK